MLPEENCILEPHTEEPGSSRLPFESANEDEEEEDGDEEDVLVRISNIFDIRGFCHVNLRNAQFNITHNESTEDFAVELLSGPNIVLHVNFRFHHHEHTLVLNASSYGTWGPEIRVHNPLHDGDHFHLHIHVHHSHYNIEVNGTRVAEFPHRYPFFTVQALGIRGGVEVQKIHFEGFPFRNNWNSGSYDYGHGGYIGYGTESYVQPNWSESHEYNQHFGHHHHHH